MAIANGLNGHHETNRVKLDETTKYGREAVKKTLNSAPVPNTSKDHSLVLATFRVLIADLCQQFNGGHPGGAVGMAAIGIAPWRYTMRYAPHTPDFFNRDRFVLSNGHTCLFQYAFLHLTGYRSMTFDQLKSYHSKRYDALCPDHPEIEHEGIEVTTGPLGQSIANAVSMAVAGKHLGATFNRPGYPIVSDQIYCMVGDACLQEGVGLEAISMAGHWRLGNLTVIYDNNQITCDGSVDMTNTENINQKMAACGWNVVDIWDGCYDVEVIVDALHSSKSSNKPTFINIRTIIGLGSAVAGQAVAHGAAFGTKDVAAMNKAYCFDSEQLFVIPDEIRDVFGELPKRGEGYVREWQRILRSCTQAHPDLAKHFKTRTQGRFSENWESLIPLEFPQKATATRAASGLVFHPIAEKVPNFMVGTADLTPSVNMSRKSNEAFQASGVSPGSYCGRYIHYGIREHGMAAVANGIAAYHPNVIVPITSSFFVFYLIGMGEDGPTHQPIELAALYRAMPNLLYIRPGDSEEVAGAWTLAIQSKQTPSIISTSRHALPQLTPLTKREGVLKGAYVLEEDEDADVTLIGAGAELNLADSLARKLIEVAGVRSRIVSMPCQTLFDAQTREYRQSVLRRRSNRPTVVVEAYAADGWERYANASISMSTDRFGQSLPGPVAYECFGFTVDKMTTKVQRYLKDVASDPELLHESQVFSEYDGKEFDARY